MHIYCDDVWYSFPKHIQMYMTIEALADGGVMAGLTRELATTMAAQTMLVRTKCIWDLF